MASLAGILIVVSYNMSEWRSFKSILGGSLFDIIILLSTFFLTVLVDLTIAIQIGVVLSALLFMKRMSDIAEKRINNVVDSDIIDDYSSLPEGVAIYEISGPLFFGSARRYTEVIENVGMKSKILIIRMRHVSFVDQTGLHNLKGTIKNLKSYGVLLIFSGVNNEVLIDFEKNKITCMVERSNIFSTFDEALSYAKEKIKTLK